MRLLPQTLFGRLVLVMIAGLVAALVVVAVINSAERDRLLYRAGGMRLAQQIADIVRLLDSLPAEERGQVVAIFNAPPLAVSLNRKALARGDEGGFQMSMFTTLLRYELGEERQLVVVRPAGSARPFAPPISPEGGAYGMRLHWMKGSGRGFLPGGPSFMVQVTLRDGTLASFDSVVSSDETPIPLRLLLTLAVLLVAVVVLSLVAVRWATAPLATLAAAAEALGDDINRPPLPEKGSVEVKRAAAAFNAMQQRLSRLMAERTRVLSAISHDLKTPITRLRLRTEMLEDEGLRAKFEKDLQEMQSLVSQALDFARGASDSEAVQPIDLMALIESVQSDFVETGGRVDLSGTAQKPYRGRPLALRRCLTNLVDNAIRYGERASILIEDGPALLTIRVRDHGAGLPEEQIELAFEPFFRGEASRSRETGGTGLGLAIARNIARSHAGDVTLRNRPEGGLEATLTLRRA